MDISEPNYRTQSLHLPHKKSWLVSPFLKPILEFLISPVRTDLEVPPGVSPSFIYTRERILSVIIVVSALLSLPALIQSIPSLIVIGRLDLFLAFTVPVIVVWGLALHRRLDYRLRTRLLLGIVYALALVELINYGDSPESHEYLLALTILATLFLDGWAGSRMIVLSLVTLGVFDWLFGTGRFIPFEMASTYTKILPLEELITTWLDFCVVVIAINVGLVILMNSLNRAWQREHELVNLLQQERDQLEQRVVERTHALAEARDQALRASQYKTELMAKVSHDLRTPLAAILGYTELWHNEVLGPITATQKNSAAKVLDSTYHLTGLINDLLDQAQIERGQIQIHEAPFYPGAIADEMRATMQLLAQAKGLSFTIEVTPDLPSVLLGDAIRLKQILTNLINNALKFTETGGVIVRLECAGSDRWALKVADTGPGIPEEAQAHIYETFWQVDNSVTHQHKGYGLGLSIVKQLTRLMNGEIVLESEMGRGSTFRVVLPLQLPDKDQETDHLVFTK
ncbi:MAG: hypothetical protein KJ077_19970 [Anaerolineae bacterium]|nr:hypothetical protein [Anaerolineae bacterium]